MDKDLKKCGLWFTIVSILYVILGILYTILFIMILKTEYAFLLSIPFIIIFIFGIMGYWMMLDFMGYRAKLIEGENRKIRKQKKQIYKLQAQKNYLENKKDREEEMITLNCKIQNLKLELKGKHILCEACGAKIYRKACFCSQCGGAVK